MDEFTKSYIKTALWSSTDDEGNLDDNHNIEDISEETLKVMVKDCQKFQEAHLDDICDDLSLAGHDFWLTRNGHGAGFWDGDWPKEVGQRLTQASEISGEVNLYVGDDGKIYGGG